MKSSIKERNIFRGYGGVLAVLVILIILFSFLSPYFLTTNNILTVLSQSSIIAIIALGMTFVLLLGETDLSVGAIAALSGLVLGLGLDNGLPIIISVLLALLVGIIAGLFNGIISATFKLPAFIVTVATLGIFRGVGYSLTDSRPVPISNSFILSVGNDKLFEVIPYTVIVMVFLFLVFHIVLTKTKFGRRAKMTGGNRTAAEYVGINTKKIQLIVFMISGFASAISGMLLASRLYSAQPNAADGYELDAIAAAVLGGTSLSGGQGTVIGTFLGAVIMGIINNGMNLIGLPYFFQQIVKGAIILGAVIMDARNKKKDEEKVKRVGEVETKVGV